MPSMEINESVIIFIVYDFYIAITQRQNVYRHPTNDSRSDSTIPVQWRVGPINERLLIRLCVCLSVGSVWLASSSLWMSVVPPDPTHRDDIQSETFDT